MGYYAKRFFGQGVIPTDYMLAYDFSGNLTDKSVNANNGVGSGTYSFVTGRKGNDTAISFTNGLVTVPNPVIIGSDKVTVSMWLKYSDTAYSRLLSNTTQEIEISLSELFTNILRNNIVVRDYTTTYNIQGIRNPLFSEWNHFVLTIDRSLPALEEKRMYLNGLLVQKVSTNFTNNLSGNFKNALFSIGNSRAISANMYKGQIQQFKVYNRNLTQEEINALYNE